MSLSDAVRTHLLQEAEALRERLSSVMPFDLQMSTVAAAALTARAKCSIDAFIERGKRRIDGRLARLSDWLRAVESTGTDDASAQRRLTAARVQANTMISRFDLYADVLTQRSEHRVGIWLSGLETAAEDALRVGGLRGPPVVCYLDRGAGAAIRRARTRLPGGELNPVALVRIPRERMVGSGVGSSLVHEVGHQASELLGLAPSLQPVLRGLGTPGDRAWPLWSRWLGEILADFWSVARVGPTAVMGLISVVSLPRAFVFRVTDHDPHPFPFIRVRLACAIAEELYPSAQWARLDGLWRSLYPVRGLDREKSDLVRELSGGLRGLARLLAEHRPRTLGGRSLREALVAPGRSPRELLATVRAWERGAIDLSRLRPCHALAVLGQARACGRLEASMESRTLERLLTTWALRRSRRQTAELARVSGTSAA